MENVTLAPDWAQHFHDNNGNPASGWFVYVFESSTEDYKESYSDPDGTVLHTQPIVLNGRGEFPGQGLYLKNNEAYTLELRDSDDVSIRTVDKIVVSDFGSSNVIVDRMYYLDTVDGDDANSGLLQGEAWKTATHAINTIKALNTNNSKILNIINVSAAVFDGALWDADAVYPPNLTIIQHGGIYSTVQNVMFSNFGTVFRGGTLDFKNVTIQSRVVMLGLDAVNITDNCVIQFSDVAIKAVQVSLNSTDGEPALTTQSCNLYIESDVFSLAENTVPNFAINDSSDIHIHTKVYTTSVGTNGIVMTGGNVYLDIDEYDGNGTFNASGITALDAKIHAEIKTFPSDDLGNWVDLGATEGAAVLLTAFLGERNNKAELNSGGAGSVTINVTVAGEGIGGSGTLNTIPKFTPDGTSIGNSIMTEGTDSVRLTGNNFNVFHAASTKFASLSVDGDSQGLYFSGGTGSNAGYMSLGNAQIYFQNASGGEPTYVGTTDIHCGGPVAGVYSHIATDANSTGLFIQSGNGLSYFESKLNNTSTRLYISESTSSIDIRNDSLEKHIQLIGPDIPVHLTDGVGNESKLSITEDSTINKGLVVGEAVSQAEGTIQHVDSDLKGRIESRDMSLTGADIQSGIILTEQSITTVKDGGSWYAEIEATGGGDLVCNIGGTYYTLDCTTGAGTGGKARSIDPLTLGTATVKSNNFIYIDLDGSTPQLCSATVPNGLTPYANAGLIILFDDAYTTTYGANFYQRFNDSSVHSLTQRGLLSELAEHARIGGIRIATGLEATTDITTNAGSKDDLEASFLAGVAYQLHPQFVPAYPKPNEYIVANDPTTPYKIISNLNEIIVDANGGSLTGNNTYFGLDFGMSVSSEGEEARFYVYLPDGSYSNASDAEQDVSNYGGTRFTLDEQAYLVSVCRMVVRYQVTASGTYVNVLAGNATQDKRNASGAGGGGSAGGGAFSLTADTGTAETISNGSTMLIEGGANISTDVNSPDTVTIDLDLSGVYAQTTDPLVAGQLWNNSGVLTFSDG